MFGPDRWLSDYSNIVDRIRLIGIKVMKGARLTARLFDLAKSCRAVSIKARHRLNRKLHLILSLFKHLINKFLIPWLVFCFISLILYTIKNRIKYHGQKVF